MLEGLTGGRCPYACPSCPHHLPATTHRRRGCDPRVPLSWLSRIWGGPHTPDAVVLGAGEDPLLWTGLPTFVRALRRFGVPVVVRTPGPLLSRPTLRRVLQGCVVVAKWDAPTPSLLRALHRPHRGVRLERLVAHYALMAQACPPRFWLQTVVVPSAREDPAYEPSLLAGVRKTKPGRWLVVGGEQEWSVRAGSAVVYLSPSRLDGCWVS